MDNIIWIGLVIASLWLKNQQNAAAASEISRALTEAPGDTVSNVISTIENFFTPRGIRNNNPGNIRHSASQWQGMAPQQTDSNFVQFVSPEYGIRAISKILDTYTVLGLNTVRGLINRWAPPNENATGAYVQAVASAVGVDPDAIINVSQLKPQIIAAIIQQENGQQPYDMTQINNGVMMA